MEATSARMASSRGAQFDGFAPPKSSLQRFIYNACDPISNFEPNLALNLEIVDLINSKKGNAPREAAVTIVQLINHRNPNVSLLALALLDNCVKNCGYPFHLQISTKEFLNELVRRFPERPPARPSRVQNKILEAIEEWRETICQTSRYKDDLGYIRDMHRLLLYKGYMFPEVRREDAAVLNPSDVGPAPDPMEKRWKWLTMVKQNLKSAEEMEAEERAAQSAKLQELIRRGGPQDLQEANRLMKVMAGYDTRHKTDYRAKAAEEVAKVQQKAKILEEMLQNHKEGEKIGEGDVFEELANALQSAHPKIQRMCEEESEDAEAVAKLLEINDSIHRTIERYKLMKAGNIEAANRIEKGTLGTTTGVGKNAANELSLIDFDPEPPTASSSSAAATNGSLLETGGPPNGATSVENDLLGLSLGGTSNSTGMISLGSTTTSTMQQPFSYPTQTVGRSITPTTSPPPIQQSTKPNYDAFAALTSSLPLSKPATPVPAIQHPPHQQQQRPLSQTSLDPFAALVSSSSRPQTPSQQRNVSQPTQKSSSLLDLAQPQPGPATSSGATADDDWNFTSALPELPTSQTIQVHSSQISISFTSRRQSTVANSPITIQAHFSNSTPQPISGLHFQVAVEKAYALQLRPQSGRDLGANQKNALQQDILLTGVPNGKGNGVKMRFKISYQWGGQSMEEQGSVPSLGIA